MSRKKLVVAYLFLVGAPLLGLLGILRTGQRLAAPASVAGAWNLEGQFSTLTDAACRKLISDIGRPFFTISQSGPHLTFTLNNPQQTTLPGMIQQSMVSTGDDAFANGSSRGCAQPQAIHLQAELSQRGVQRSLAGTLTIAGCAECATIPFRAVRLVPPAKDRQ